MTMNKEMVAYPPLRARRHKLQISKGRDLVGDSSDPYPLLLSFTQRNKRGLLQEKGISDKALKIWTASHFCYIHDRVWVK